MQLSVELDKWIPYFNYGIYQNLVIDQARALLN
jgi:hypothetical protein